MDSNFKKLNFCNFSAHFSPIALPTRTPSFSPQGASFGHEFSSTPLSVRPIISPFRGNLWGSFEAECCASLSKSDAFGVIFDQSERETGEISGRMDGENFRDFYSEGSPERAWNGMAAVGKMGTKKRPQQRIATVLSGVFICETLCSSYFRRYHSTHKNSLHLHHSTPQAGLSRGICKIWKNLTLNGQNHKCPQGHSTILLLYVAFHPVGNIRWP